MKLAAAVIVIMVVCGGAQAQTVIDLGTIKMVPGTQTVISPNDTFSMNGYSHITDLPSCSAGQHWHQWLPDPARPNFKPAYVFSGTAPDHAIFSWRDPATGKALGHNTGAVVCE